MSYSAAREVGVDPAPHGADLPRPPSRTSVGTAESIEPATPTDDGLSVAKPDRRVVTVLFADIVNSTRMIAAADPEDASESLSVILDLFGHQVSRFGGTLCQTLGDGVLAVFGAPDAVEDHAVRACLAAEAIVRSAKRDSRIDFDVRVGVCSGEVLWDAAAMNGGIRPPAIGRTVHAAAKLQQSARPNTVRISDSTAALAGGWLHLDPCGEIPLSETDSLQAHLILGTYSRPRRPEDETPPVGRNAELASLTTAMDVAHVGRGRTIVLAGAPGVGKTHLSRRLVSIAQRRGLRVLEWQMHSVRPVGAPDALAELVEAVFERGIPDQRGVLVGMLAAGGIAANRAEAMADLLLPAQRRPGMDPQGLLNLSAEGAGDMIRSAAADEPLMLLVEDLHWAGTDARAVLDRLTEMVRDTPLLILATSREEQTELKGATVHPLAPMDPTAARELLDLLVGKAPGLEEVKDSIAARAQGNPYFLTECVRALRADGILTGPPGDHRLGQSAGAGRLPQTVQALLTARIDSLQAPQRNLLLTAAVIGQTFDAGLLAAVAGLSDDDAASRLSDISACGLIDATRLLPRLEYTFRHALLQEAAYATLTKKDRKALHLDLAKRLDSDGNFSLLANRTAAITEHAFHAELWKLAFSSGMSAARLALAGSKAQETLNLLSMVEAAATHLGESYEHLTSMIDARLLSVKARIAIGEKKNAESDLEKALDLSVGLSDSERQISTLVIKCSFQWIYGTVSDSIRSGERALLLSSKLEPAKAPHFEILNLLAGPYLEFGSVAKAEELLQQSLYIASSNSQRPNKYMTLDATLAAESKLSLAYALSGKTEFIDIVKSALDRCERSERPHDRILSYYYCSEALTIKNIHSLSATISEKAVEECKEYGFGVLIPLLRARRIYNFAHSGSFNDSTEEMREVRQIANNKQIPSYIAKIGFYYASTLLMRGDVNGAVEEAHNGLQFSKHYTAWPTALRFLSILSKHGPVDQRGGWQRELEEKARQMKLTGLLESLTHTNGLVTL